MHKDAIRFKVKIDGSGKTMNDKTPVLCLDTGKWKNHQCLMQTTDLIITYLPIYRIPNFMETFGSF